MNEKEFIKVAGLVNAKDVINHAPEKAQRYSPQYEAYYKQGKATWMWLEGYEGWIRNEVFQEPYDQAIDLSEIKELVKSLEIINDLEGLKQSKSALRELNELGWNSFEHRWIDNWTCTKERLEQAISDYEDVYVNDVIHQIQYGIPVLSNSKAGCVYFPYTSITIGIDLAKCPDWTPPVSINGDDNA